MLLSTAIIFLVVAIVLLLIEIFLIPGTGFVGIIGFVLLLIGIYGSMVKSFYGRIRNLGRCIDCFNALDMAVF